MRLFIGILLFFAVIAACSSDEVVNQEVGEDFLESDVLVRVIDTFSIQTGTFKLNELATSSTGRILLGHVVDDNFGSLTSQSYFQLSSLETPTLEEGTYDSIGFILNYDRYYHGDTLQPQTYTFHRIIETVEPRDDDDTSLFNTDTLAYDREILGQITFTPRPNRASDSLYIPLSDALGEEIFNKIQDDEIDDVDDFLNEYKGFTIVPTTTTSTHILGFNTSSISSIAGNSSLRIYYTPDDQEDTDDEAVFIDFVITDTSALFNGITTDLSNSVLSEFVDELDDDENTVDSSDTDNQFFVQGASGISAKIEIPSIKQLNLLSEFGSSLDAELTFRPLPSSFRSGDILQDSLFVFIVNDRNEIQSQLTVPDGTNALAILNESESDFNDIYYSVDVSNFVDIILGSEEDLDVGLMIQFNDLNEAVENVVLDGGNNNDSRLKLSVKYLNF